MKRVGLWALGIGVFLSVGPLTVERGYADENDDATTCTLATLKGRYLFAINGTVFPPAEPQQSLEARAGYRIFYGDGTGTYIATQNVNGRITSDFGHGDLSYTVNANCTGTLGVLPAGPQGNQELFIAPNGDGITAITTGSRVEAYSMWRVGRE
jgi:hypothetical protein